MWRLQPDTATNCSNCGVNLFTGQNRPYMGYEHRRNYDERYQYRRTGAGVGLLIAGLFIIIIGSAYRIYGVLELFLASITHTNWLMGSHVGFEAEPPLQASTNYIAYQSWCRQKFCYGIARFLALHTKSYINFI